MSCMQKHMPTIFSLLLSIADAHLSVHLFGSAAFIWYRWGNRTLIAPVVMYQPDVLLTNGMFVGAFRCKLAYLFHFQFALTAAGDNLWFYLFQKNDSGWLRSISQKVILRLLTDQPGPCLFKWTFLVLCDTIRPWRGKFFFGFRTVKSSIWGDIHLTDRWWLVGVALLGANKQERKKQPMFFSAATEFLQSDTVSVLKVTAESRPYVWGIFFFSLSVKFVSGLLN